MLYGPWRSQILIFIQFCRHPNFTPEKPSYPALLVLKFGYQRNWMKIEIWDLQGLYIIVVQLVPVENDIPYLPIFQRLRE